MNDWYSSNTCRGSLNNLQEVEYGRCDFQYLWIHDVGSNICICDMFSKSAAQLCLDFLKVQRFQANSGSAVDSGSIANDLRPQRLGETAKRLSQIALEELYDGGRKVKGLRPFQHIFLGKRIGGHPLSKITNNFR